MNNSAKWSLSKSETFWRDIAPGEHVLQIYENDEVFLNTLASFVGTGINAGESVVLIMFPEHKKLLEDKLRQHALQLDMLISGNRFLVFDANETLNKFLVDGWPDEKKFREVIGEVIRIARGPENRKVRAFGEMVAILWERDDKDATIRLEEYWDTYCQEEKISLFCAYPRNIFKGENPHEEIGHVCNTHSKIIRDSKKPLTEVMYQEVHKIA